MRGALAVIAVVLIGLVALTPFACASTYEAWTEGVYDAELDNDIRALLTFRAVIDRSVRTDRGSGDMGVAVVVRGGDTGGGLADPSARSARAPPTACPAARGGRAPASLGRRRWPLVSRTPRR